LFNFNAKHAADEVEDKFASERILAKVSLFTETQCRNQRQRKIYKTWCTGYTCIETTSCHMHNM